MPSDEIIEAPDALRFRMASLSTATSDLSSGPIKSLGVQGKIKWATVTKAICQGHRKSKCVMYSIGYRRVSLLPFIVSVTWS